MAKTTVRCLNCGKDDRIKVHGYSVWYASASREGDELLDTGYSNDSKCVCEHCGYTGVFDQFEFDVPSKNTNCLEGVICPACNNEDAFYITGTSTWLVHDDGTESHDWVEWDDESQCVCKVCNFTGRLKEFKR